MTKRKTYDVSPVGNGSWAVKARGGQRASAVESNKTDAVEKARAFAKVQQPSQVVIRRQDGSSQIEYTYKDDPCPPKG
jgi:hypothetical protein